MPPSFAITELLIVLTASFCSLKLRKCYPFAAIGIILFGLAALIGVYRFLSGEVEQLASIHKYFSRSNNGTAGFSACASTRRLNASCDNSRFRYGVSALLGCGGGGD